MISNKMKSLVLNSSTIRSMFEEGKRLSGIYGEKNVFDYSIGNPNVEPPESVKKVINEILRLIIYSLFSILRRRKVLS